MLKLLLIGFLLFSSTLSMEEDQLAGEDMSEENFNEEVGEPKEVKENVEKEVDLNDQEEEDLNVDKDEDLDQEEDLDEEEEPENEPEEEESDEDLIEEEEEFNPNRPIAKNPFAKAAKMCEEVIDTKTLNKFFDKPQLAAPINEMMKSCGNVINAESMMAPPEDLDSKLFAEKIEDCGALFTKNMHPLVPKKVHQGLLNAITVAIGDSISSTYCTALQASKPTADDATPLDTCISNEIIPAMSEVLKRASYCTMKSFKKCERRSCGRDQAFCHATIDRAWKQPMVLLAGCIIGRLPSLAQACPA